MRLVICAVGRRGDLAERTADYLSRAERTGRQLGLSGPVLHEVEAPRAAAGTVRRAREASLLLGAVPERARVVLMEETGKDVTSLALSRLIGRQRDEAAPALAFLIGGADGFDPSLRAGLAERTVATLAFGRATWPHMLLRLMLAEQLYRATTILSGHPYHRA